MPKGYALLVGLKEVNPEYYGGNRLQSGKLAAEKDVDTMGRILSRQGFSITALKTAQATIQKVRSQLQNHIQHLTEGDIFVFFYSGHGGTCLDWGGDELDGMDETLCLYDGEWVDDEFLPIWEQAPLGSRLLMIADSCHSETVFKNSKGFPIIKSKPLMDDISGHAMRTMLLHLGAALDAEVALGDSESGVLTHSIESVWDNGNFRGNYEAFFNIIIERIAKWQNGAYHTFGPINRAFLDQTPFTI